MGYPETTAGGVAYQGTPFPPMPPADFRIYPLGWRCPECGVVHAPWVQYCLCRLQGVRIVGSVDTQTEDEGDP